VIARLRGTLREKEPARVVIDCQGIGFELGVPLSTSRVLGKPGDPAELLVITRFTREGMELYGFAEKAERDVFELLTSVRGIGPKAGLNLLSRFRPEEIRAVIAGGKLDVLRTVPGIGPKKAQRLMDELREQAAPAETAEPLFADAHKALVCLGLTSREARTRLERVKPEPGATLEQVLKQALAERPTSDSSQPTAENQESGAVSRKP